MFIKFITSSKEKFSEVSAIISGLERVELDLPEVQSLDPEEVIREKLIAAQGAGHDEFIVEDTSLFLEAFGGSFPGPLIKWLLKAVGPKGMSELVVKLGNTRSRAVSHLGYIGPDGKMRFAFGENLGSIVLPRGDQDFAWGPCFVPDGSDMTFGEMTREEKSTFSMRGKAARKLKASLKL